jgi:hypothetical protein
VRTGHDVGVLEHRADWSNSRAAKSWSYSMLRSARSRLRTIRIWTFRRRVRGERNTPRPRRHERRSAGLCAAEFPRAIDPAAIVAQPGPAHRWPGTSGAEITPARFSVLVPGEDVTLHPLVRRKRGGRLQDSRFSAPRSQGKRASSTTMLSAVVLRDARWGTTASAGVARRARRIRWLRPNTLPPRAPWRRSCSGDLLNRI